MEIEDGGPGRDRTFDQAVMSRLLLPLSYRPPKPKNGLLKTLNYILNEHTFIENQRVEYRTKKSVGHSIYTTTRTPFSYLVFLAVFFTALALAGAAFFGFFTTVAAPSAFTPIPVTSFERLDFLWLALFL